jgi:hypothetical protein
MIFVVVGKEYDLMRAWRLDEYVYYYCICILLCTLRIRKTILGMCILKQVLCRKKNKTHLTSLRYSNNLSSFLKRMQPLFLC